MPNTYYGSKDFAVTFGGASITAMVNPNTEVERKAILHENTPFGVAWPVWLATGSKRLSDITFGGVEDFQAATGSRALLAEGTSGALVVTYGGAKTTLVTCIVESYKTTMVAEKLHVFTVVLRPTGTVTEA